MPEEITKPWKFTINFKQSAKGEWYAEKVGVHAETKAELIIGLREAFEAYKERKRILIEEQYEVK